MKKTNYSEIEYFKDGISVGINCLPERSTSNMRKEIFRITFWQKPIIDRVVIWKNDKIRLDSNGGGNAKELVTELYSP